MDEKELEEIKVKQQFKDDTLLKRYKEGKQYQDSMQFTSKWPEYERFYAGDQWPPATARTKDLPRPVFNIIEYIQIHKKSSVLTENIKMIYSSEEINTEDTFDQAVDLAMDGADKFTKFSETTWEHIQQDKLNDEVMSSASNCGTGVLHYYWDNSKKGGISKQYIGEIAGEFIDPANLFVSNPQCTDIQKQEWVILTKRETIDNIKKIAENNGVPSEYLELLTSDENYVDELYDTAQHEMKSSKKATVIIEYSKKDGKVYFRKAVGDIIIQPLTETGLTRYPIALMIWKPRKKCIYGIGDTEGLIPNQKAINLTLAMMMLSVQQTAWPKILAKPGAIQQTITNTPGEIITDYYMGQNQDGVKYMNPGQFNPMALTLVDKFMDITKSLAGANDAAVGEAPGADMAAQAIMLLQKSAGLPLENIKQRYYQCMEDVGRIWEDFYKTFYNTTRNFKYTDEQGAEQMGSFKGSEYAQFPMSLKIDIGPASTYSEYMAQSTLDNLLNGGMLPVEIYLKYCTRNALPSKNEILRDYKEYQMQQAMMTMGQVGGMSAHGGSGDASIDPTMLEAGGNSTLGIAPVHEPSLETIGTNNGKL